MKIVRKIVGALILFFNWVFSPSSMTRDRDAQSRIDTATANLKLYEFHACPFCVKVRREIKRLNLNIELRDVKNEGDFRNELLENGGKIKAPCLRIEDSGNLQWMYESSDIVSYLQERFGR
jgi:glutaredoxin